MSKVHFLHLKHRLPMVSMAILGLLVALNLPVAALDANESIALSPTSRHYELNPGETVADEMTVLNSGTTAYDFVVYASPYSIENTTYDPNFDKTPPSADAYKWVSFQKTTWHIEPRETVKVPYTMTVAQNASPGGHYGVIFAETKAPNDGAINRSKRLGLVLYATVKGAIVREGSITGIETEWYQSQAPIVSTIHIANTGNTDFTSKQSIGIKNVFGKVLHTQTVETVVLPDRPRDVKVEWNGASWLGLYKVRTTALALDSQKTTEQYVLVAPVWFLLTIIVFVAAGVVYALRSGKTK